MMRSMKKTLTALLFTGSAALLFATAAFAEGGLAVRGEAYYGTDGLQFVVENTSGGPAFFDVQRGEEYLARHMLCEDGVTNPVACELEEGQTPAEYTVTLYTGRNPGEEAVALSGSGVYAMTPDGSLYLMATYPGFEGEGFTPNATFYADGVDYDLADADPQPVEGGYAYRYERYTPAALTGSVTYVDVTGAILKTDEIDGITAETPVSYSLPESFVLNGSSYYPSLRSVTAVYDGQVDFVVLCQKQGFEGDGVYRAIIKMVDESGAVLMTDHLNVSRVYTYSLPTSFVLRSDATATAYTYQPRAGEGSVFTMRPGDAGDAASKEYTFTYTAKAENATADWIIRKVNGVNGALLGTESIPVEAGQTADYTAADLTVDGTVYTPAGSNKYSYTYGGDNLLQTIYYVPAGYQPESSYDITVQYRSIADGTILHTESITVQPGQDTVFTTPAVFGDYLRLAGQSDTTRHNFYSPRRSYVIYYRGVNDTLYADTIITVTETVTTTRTEYNVVTLPAVDGGTTDLGTTDLGTTDLGVTGASGTSGTGAGGTGNGGAAGTGASGENAYAAGPAAGEELTAANNDTTGQSNLLTENGQDTAAARDEIIAENEVPLAQNDGSTIQGDAADDSAALHDAARPGWQVATGWGLGLLGLVLLGLIGRQAYRRRNRS